MMISKEGISKCLYAEIKLVNYVLKVTTVHVLYISALQPDWVNPDIRVKWVTFSPGCRVKLKNSGFIILSNIAVINNTSDCSIREYRSYQSDL